MIEIPILPVPVPVPFWDSPAFTSVMVLFVAGLVGLMQARQAAHVAALRQGQADVAQKVDEVKNDQKTVVEKVKIIETHTNGMLTALQTKVDVADTAKRTTAEITEKDKEIAKLKSETPKKEI